MKHMVLNGKKYRLRGTIGAIEKITKKYNDMGDMFKWSDAKIFSFYYDLVWSFLDHFPKPFLFKWRFKQNADIDDIRNSADALWSILTGSDKIETEGDREKGNSKKSVLKNGSSNT